MDLHITSESACDVAQPTLSDSICAGMLTLIVWDRQPASNKPFAFRNEKLVLRSRRYRPNTWRSSELTCKRRRHWPGSFGIGKEVPILHCKMFLPSTYRLVGEENQRMEWLFGTRSGSWSEAKLS